MKKIFILSSLVLVTLQSIAQTVVFDTVSTGAGYPNQVFYNLQNGNKNAALMNEWDLAFQVNLMTAGIHINSINGVALYRYPSAAASANAFANFDTTGSAAWPRLYNSENKWENGAFNATAAGVSPFDFGWGNYQGSPGNNVIGDSLYLLVKGSTKYKFWLMEKTNTNKYIFRFAAVDGSVDVTDTVDAQATSSKNMVYYNLASQTTLDREPAAGQWQLLFTRYTSFVPQPAPAYYPVTGVVSNKGVKIAQVAGVDTDTYTDTTGAGFSTDINVIGYDWKQFSPPAGPWVIEDSLVYFVLTPANELWKLVFTDFGGSATGNYIFSKEKLSVTTGVVENNVLNNITVYPNPANSSAEATLVYTLNSNANAWYALYDMSGRLLQNQLLNGQTGLHTHFISTANLAPGMYILNVHTGNTVNTKKLVVK